MEVRKGYKQTEVGIVSNDWREKKFEDVMTGFSSGATPYRGRPEYYKGNIKWITSGELNYNVITDTIEKITEEAVRNTNLKILPIGTFLMAITGLEAKGTRGSCGIVGAEATTNQSCMALFPNENLDSGYLYHYYVWQGDNLAFRYCQGTKQQSYTGKLARILPIVLPPTKAEQTAIATALSDTNSLINSLEKLIDKKRAIKEGAMQELLTGKRRLPGFGGEWKVKKIGNIAPLQRGFDLPNPQLKKGIYPVVYSNGIGNYHSNYMAKAPGVVTGRSGTLGKVTYITKDYWPHNTALWVTDFKGNYPLFIYYLYINIKLERFGTGSGVPTLNRNDVHDFKITIPSTPTEQIAIAQILSDMDKEIETLEEKLTKYRQIKQGMMQELLTGRTRLV